VAKKNKGARIKNFSTLRAGFKAGSQSENIDWWRDYPDRIKTYAGRKKGRESHGRESTRKRFG